MSDDPLLAELKERLAEVDDLGGVGGLLSWDQQTCMPPAGAATRAAQRATVHKLAHELFTHDRVGELLEQLAPLEESLPYDSDEAGMLRVTRRAYDKARRVPASLAAEMSHASSEAHEAWVEAREASDFALFRPHLERGLELRQRYIDCFPPAENPYDILLDDYEEGMTAAEATAVFDELKASLVPLIDAVVERADTVDDSFLHGTFPRERQEWLVEEVLQSFGFDRASWRLDTVIHPFALSLGPGDVRITTRFHEDYLPTALFGAMHECGHGLYEAGIDPRLARTGIGHATSLSIHESQSRMWENLVGRSRPFWQRFFPDLARSFPDTFGGMDAEAFYRGVNKVQPSLIRIEADEATYNLHIVLRFELEQDVTAGRLAIADLPEAWNQKMRDYLGIEVPDDAHGVLQDVHWSFGFGYFPTYSLGNVIAGQLWDRIRVDIPDIDERIGRAELADLREWLREHVHRHGAKYTMRELLERVVGTGLDPQPYARSLQAKLADIYGL
ncbi:MAG: carboxypeptidase M32 [Thermoleophilia bacterium]